MAIHELDRRSTEEKTGLQVYGEIQDALTEHTNRRRWCLNMIASENAMSPATRAVLSSDLGNRYTVGPTERLFPGLESYTKIEKMAIGLMQEMLLGADHVNVQPLSGMVANMVAYHAMINRGDKVWVVKEKFGGHYSHRKGEDMPFTGPKAQSLLDMYGAEVDYLPFDPEEYNVDLWAVKNKVMTGEKPKLIIVGASEMLFPVPLRELRYIVGEDTQILYDAAHVLGLILGGEFQQPLIEGADMVASSTNKTLGAPCHGMVAWTEEAEKKYHYRDLVNKALVPMFTSNHHGHHVAGLAITLAEMKTFGPEYAQQVVKNAKALGRALEEEGLKIVANRHGYTESHEILIDIGMDSTQAKEALALANIIVSKCPIPTYKITNDEGDPSTGLRLGTNEITRMGMKEPEMKTVARLIATALQGKSPDGVKPVLQQVTEFMGIYQKQNFCF